MFIQSRVPEHSELHLLLSMITPLGWLERVPTYKDQQEQLKDKDLATYGFLGYPLLQSADILLYKPTYVPVGEDQVAHVEITREVARRFNHIYGREPRLRSESREGAEESRQPQQHALQGVAPALSGTGRCEAVREGACACSKAMRVSRSPIASACSGYLEGTGRSILVEPEALLTATPKVPGLDGRKMSKSYGNTIGLARRSGFGREEAEDDADGSGARAPHRSGRSGEMPGLGPAQDLLRRGHPGLGAAGLSHRRHRLPRLQEALDRRRRGGDHRIRTRAQEFEENRDLVRGIIAEGCEKARDVARQTLEEVASRAHGTWITVVEA